MIRTLIIAIAPKMTAETTQMRVLLKAFNSYVELKSWILSLVKVNAAMTAQIAASEPISTIVNALRFLIENTNEKTKYAAKPRRA